QSHSAVNNRLTKPEGQASHTLLRTRRSGRIKVVGARHSGHVRIKAIAMPLPDNFLEDDGHLLFVGIVACRPDVVARFPEVRGSVYELDGLSQSPETRVLIELVVRDHLGPVNAGEWPIKRILQQAGRSDRQRSFDLRDQCPEIA